MKKIINKLFNGLNITWPKLVLFSIIMGVYTAIMAMCVPDGNSFHDIAVTPEWWVLPAIIIITNSKKPIEAALKTFVFFLISQPLVYLIQVPFNSMGWGLFGYYPYWFSITVLTFPAAFIGWFMVDAERQSLGIVAQLFADVRAAMKGQGFDYLSLGVLPENTDAIAFWEKQGFAFSGEEGTWQGRPVSIMERSI